MNWVGPHQKVGLLYDMFKWNIACLIERTSYQDLFRGQFSTLSLKFPKNFLVLSCFWPPNFYPNLRGCLLRYFTKQRRRLCLYVCEFVFESAVLMYWCRQFVSLHMLGHVASVLVSRLYYRMKNATIMPSNTDRPPSEPHANSRLLSVLSIFNK